MRDWLRGVLGGRPWWMNALMVFSAYMAFIYVPWDFLMKPAAIDEEVWFGIRFHGFAAKLTEPIHWAIFMAGAYGFRRMRNWMWPWAAVYAGQVAIGMLVWSWVYIGGMSGFFFGIVSFLPFAGLTLALWRSRAQFQEPRRTLRQRYGEWGLVTGASAGIGAEFARALAREGVSCVLTARREDRLHALAAELEKQHQVATRVIAADLARPEEVDRLAEAVSDLEIGVLVNNAGFGYSGRFEHLDTQRLRDMVQVNCAAPVVLTSRLLPRMRERGCGAVIITGSAAAHQPVPLHGVYSATKAFDLLFGESLWAEFDGTGIEVLVLEPGPTETEFQQVAGELPHPGQSAAEVVAVALDSLGHRPSVLSSWFNWLRANAASRLLPRALTAQIAKQVMQDQTPADMR